jgi:hypothetical protein
MARTQAVDPTISFDDLYLSAPDDKTEMVEMRGDASLLLSDQAEAFCRELILFGRIPSEAYELAFMVKDCETGQLIKPDAAGYKASKLLKNPEVAERIRELRNEILDWYKMPREEMLMALRAIALNPDAKHSDRLTALKQISQAEGYNMEKDIPQGAQIIINMPFDVKPLTTQAQQTPVIEGVASEVIDV